MLPEKMDFLTNQHPVQFMLFVRMQSGSRTDNGSIILLNSERKSEKSSGIPKNDDQLQMAIGYIHHKWVISNEWSPWHNCRGPFLFYYKINSKKNFANGKNYSRTIHLESTSFDTMKRNDVLRDWMVTVRVRENTD